MSDRRETSEILERIQRAASRIDPALSDVEVEVLIEGARQRRRRRVVARVGLALAGTAIAGLALAVLAHRAPPADAGGVAGDGLARAGSPSPGFTPAALAPPGDSSLAPSLHLADGSRATGLDASASLAVVENSPARVTLELRRGRERFDVVPRPPEQRAFHVRAGAVTVTVVGTAFTVERIADRIGVAVEHGTVAVDWGRGARALHTGESGWFPPLAGSAAGGVDTSAVAGEIANLDRHADRAQSRGARPAAAPAIASTPAPPADLAPPPAALEEPTSDQILRAADAARAAGHASEAASLLRRLVADRPNDPRAPLAAFTLGRLLWRDLGRAREAATAFAQARALAPAGPLADDALAREAEALAAAGVPGDAQARARDYLRRYPDGRRAAALKRLGGVE